MNWLMSVAFITAAIFPVAGSFVSAQTAPEPLTVYAGSIVFNNPAFDSVALVDFPFTVKRHELQFFKPDTTVEEVEGRVFAAVIVYGVDGLAVDSSDTYFSVRAPSLADAGENELTLFNRLSVLAAPGVYTARVTVIDVVSKREGEFFLDRVVVEPPSRREMDIGAGTLAYGIKRIDDSSQIDRNVRNGYRVLANPLSVFSVLDSTIWVYAELYNLPFDEDGDAEFTLNYSAIGPADSLIRDLGTVSRRKPGGSAVIVQEIDIGGWRFGDYAIRLVATDPSSNQIDTLVLPFRLFPEAEQLAALAGRLLEDPYDTLSLEDRIRLVHYQLTPGEKQTLNMLSSEGKNNFLDQYWREKDSDPATKVIENRLQMMNRYGYVQSHFSTNSKSSDGWFSDRGRIYMTFGPWEERVDIQTPDLGDPYEVWYYHTVRGGVLFVFEDRGGLHDYRLVHSTMEGEFFDKVWEARLERDIFRRE